MGWVHMNIAVVDDDQELASLLCLWLTEAGYVCYTYYNGQAFLDDISQHQFDVVLLDMIMPEMDGEQVLAWLREHSTDEIPVIFVTARDGEEDMVRVLNEGADDYITKPVSRLQLLARITALTRRVYHQSEPELMEIGPFTINTRGRSVTNEGKPIKLTEKEFELVTYIFRNLGRLLTRQQILSSVWGYESDVNTRTVDTHISRIRKKLNLMPEFGWRLSSIYHQGYRLEQLPHDDMSFGEIV